MHLDDISLSQVIVSPKYDASSRKIYSRWSVQLLDETPFLGTDNVSIGSHFVHNYWLSRNNARDEITLRFISFLTVFVVYVVRIAILYCLCHS